jgi:hypothetical protein
MADFSVNHPRNRGARAGSFEYRLYFAPIFLFALMFALAGHAWGLLRHGQAPKPGPFARARAEAHQIVPMIFRG